MAERGRFELPIALRLCLISSQVHSTGLCHLSAFYCYLSSRLAECPKLASLPPVYRQMHNGCNAGHFFEGRSLDMPKKSVTLLTRLKS
jgi:hypothetical protein